MDRPPSVSSRGLQNAQAARDKRMLALRDQGFSCAEISTRMGVTEGTVRARIAAVRKLNRDDAGTDDRGGEP